MFMGLNYLNLNNHSRIIKEETIALVPDHK